MKVLDLNALEEARYKQDRTDLYGLISTGIPNVKSFEGEVRKLKKRMLIIENGAVFAQSEQEVYRAEHALATLRGRLRAVKEVLAYIKKRIRECQ